MLVHLMSCHEGTGLPLGFDEELPPLLEHAFVLGKFSVNVIRGKVGGSGRTAGHERGAERETEPNLGHAVASNSPSRCCCCGTVAVAAEQQNMKRSRRLVGKEATI